MGGKVIVIAATAWLALSAAAWAQNPPAAPALPVWRATPELAATGEAVMADPRIGAGGTRVMGLLQLAKPGETRNGKPFTYAMRTLGYDCAAHTTVERMTIFVQSVMTGDAPGWMERAPPGAAPESMSPALTASICGPHDAPVIGGSLAETVERLRAISAPAHP
jgi:hypothetical protein